jgi:hypothetical protein
MDYIKLDLFNKYLGIKKDIVDNLPDVYNRQNYFTRKYRGNLALDLHVGIGNNFADNTKKEVQIFLRYKGIYIKDNIIYDERDYFRSTIKTNLNE